MRWNFCAGVLLVIFFLELFFTSAAKSPAWDEPGHIASGVAYVQLGSLAVNPQHPPLLKALSGLSLTFAGARWPDVPQARDLVNGAEQWQWDIGSLILIKAGLDRALMWARLPMMLVALLGGLVLYLWGRDLAGGLAGIGALLLYILDPTIIAHAHLVTMDVGLAAFSLLFLYCLWTYTRAPRRLILAACGITLGLALCAKFSALVLVPLAAVLLIIGRYQRSSTKALPDDPCPCGSGRKFKNCHFGKSQPGFDTASLVPSIVSLLWLYAIAALVILAIYRHGPGAYLSGVTKVDADHSANYLAYLAGDLAPRFTSYFAAAGLFKEPIAAIVLAVTGLILLLRRSEFPLRDKAFLILPPLALFLLHTWKADDLGIRYIIPCLPFAHLLGGIALASLLRAKSIGPRVAAGVLALWAVVAAAGIYPDGLSYFNESACLLDDPRKLGLDGGSRCGAAWLDDSNLDWGGGLKQLKAWLEKNARGQTARLAYFGSFPPVGYDLPVELMDESRLGFQPPPGLYVISAHIATHNTALVRRHLARGDEWMLRMPPKAIVGHCLYIYELKENR